MDKYETLWKNKKSELAHAIINCEDAEDIYSIAKELAEMETDEIEYDTDKTGSKLLVSIQPEIRVCGDCSLKQAATTNEYLQPKLITKYETKAQGAGCSWTDDEKYQPQDSHVAKLFNELKIVAEPVVKFIASNYHPHTNVVIGMDFVKVVEDQMGMPTKNKENTLWD